MAARLQLVVLTTLLSLVIGLACTGSPPANTPQPSPAPTPAPLPAATLLPTIPPPPVAYFVPTGVAEFAAACQKLRDSDEEDLDRWVVEAQELEPPPELAGYWNAYIDQFALQEGGPNARTQAAYEREFELVAAMRPGLRQTLLDAGCLTEGRRSHLLPKPLRPTQILTPHII